MQQIKNKDTWNDGIKKKKRPEEEKKMNRAIQNACMYDDHTADIHTVGGGGGGRPSLRSQGHSEGSGLTVLYGGNNMDHIHRLQRHHVIMSLPGRGSGVIWGGGRAGSRNRGLGEAAEGWGRGGGMGVGLKRFSGTGSRCSAVRSQRLPGRLTASG